MSQGRDVKSCAEPQRHRLRRREAESEQGEASKAQQSGAQAEDSRKSPGRVPPVPSEGHHRCTARNAGRYGGRHASGAVASQARNDLIRVHRTPTWTAANRAAAAEKRTTPFSPRIPPLREIILRTVPPYKCSTGFDIVYRWATHWPEIAVLVQRPLAGFSTDLAALFKLPHGIKALRSTVYDHVRVGTELRIKYIVLRCRRTACKAQYCRSCEAGASQGHQAGACQRHDDHLPPAGYFAWAGPGVCLGCL
jgi:hypothetical protein